MALGICDVTVWKVLTQVWRAAPQNNRTLSTLDHTAHGTEGENFLTRKGSRICLDKMLNHVLSQNSYMLRCHNERDYCPREAQPKT